MQEEKSAEPQSYCIQPNDIVTVTKMNHLTEIQYMEKMNRTASIRKLNKDEYVLLETGEIKQFEHTKNRSESYNSLRQTFKKIRYLINNNFVGGSNELFVTLTYPGANMNDPKKLYKDLDKFIKKLKYRYKSETTIDYLHVVEPHERGGFHVHSLLRFNELKSIFIPNAELADIWGHGFVTIERIGDVDNIGAYLSAYLADVELNEETVAVAMREGREVIEKEINGETKRFIKGGRLHMYPPKFRMFRKSTGIEFPERKTMSYKNAKKVVGSAQPHYSKTYSIETDEFSNTLAFEQYNSKRK